MLLVLALGGAAVGHSARELTADETLTVAANSPTAAVSKALDARYAYRVTVTGTIGVHAGVVSECDAFYCFKPTRTGPFAVLRVNKEGQSIAEIGTCRLGKLPYQASHTYSAEVTGVAGSLRFFFADSIYEDNSGTFTITIDDLGYPGLTQNSEYYGCAAKPPARLSLTLFQKRFGVAQATFIASCTGLSSRNIFGCTVKNGAVVSICNRDGFNHHPFSLSARNSFKVVVLRPGACFERRFVNPTRSPLLAKVYDDIHSQERLVLRVMPA